MKTIVNFLEENSKKTPSKIALITENKTFTYEKLLHKSTLFANSLKHFEPNSIISLMFENTEKFVISYLGTICAGMVAHILPPNISEPNLLFQLNSSNSKLLASTSDKYKKFNNLTIEKQDFDKIDVKNNFISTNDSSNGLAHLLYTSGTTSKPKGVGITHSNLLFTLKNIVKILNYTPNDISLLPLPLYHSFGLGCLNSSLYSGGTIILLKDASNLSLIFESIKKHNISLFCAVPATLIQLIKNFSNELTKQFEYLRLIITNSTSIPADVVKQYKQILKNGNIATYYGLTEASRSTFMIFEKSLGKESSVGKPAPGVEIKIVNQKNRIGEIWIKGENVIKNYWNDSGSNEQFSNGWLKTGDLGFFDEDGFLYLSGRFDDVINVGGEKIFPEYVESIINQNNEIEESILIGIKHEIFGQTPKLFVKLKKNSNIKKSEILTFCLRNLEKHMVPTKIEFVDDFPRTEYGKIKRFKL